MKEMCTRNIRLLGPVVWEKSCWQTLIQSLSHSLMIIKELNIELLRGTRQHVQEERRGKDCEKCVSFMAPRGRSVSCHVRYMHGAAYEGLVVYVHVCGCRACVCYQWVQKCHVSYLGVPEGLESPALSIRLSLSLLIKHQESEERGKGTTQREDNKGHEREWVYVHTTVLM